MFNEHPELSVAGRLAMGTFYLTLLVASLTAWWYLGALVKYLVWGNS